MTEEKKDSSVYEKLCEQIEKKIDALTKEGIQQGNVDYIKKLIEVKKNIKKIDHMEMEEKNMLYDNYGYDYDNYGGGRSRDSRGRYMGGMNHGRYRGHDYVNDMSDNYGRYMEGKEYGRYGSPETSKAFDYMLQSAEDFFKHLKSEAGSQEEVEKLRRTAERISKM